MRMAAGAGVDSKLESKAPHTGLLLDRLQDAVDQQQAFQWRPGRRVSARRRLLLPAHHLDVSVQHRQPGHHLREHLRWRADPHPRGHVRTPYWAVRAASNLPTLVLRRTDFWSVSRCDRSMVPPLLPRGIAFSRRWWACCTSGSHRPGSSARLKTSSGSAATSGGVGLSLAASAICKQKRLSVSKNGSCSAFERHEKRRGGTRVGS